MNAYDIETYHEEEKNKFIPYCIAYKLQNKIYYEYFKDNQNIIKNTIENIINLIKKEEVIYIHNINFDGMIILNEISNFEEYEIDSLIRNMNIYSIIIKKKNKKIIFKCSFKLIPESLKKISMIFKEEEKMIFPYNFSSKKNLEYVGDVPDLEYFKNENDYVKFKKENSNFNFKEYSIKYCIRDVLITANFLEKIKKITKEYGINIDKIYSAPSLSFKIFEKKFNRKKLSFNINNTWDEIIRTSYFGGRCEVYGNPYEHEFIHYYDFSGMYSQCMREKFPYGKIKIIKNPENIEKAGFYYIKYKSENNIPILPHKNKLNGKLMFTNGINEGLFWYEEIMLFIENKGLLLEIKYGLIYENYDFVFTEFIENFEEIKKKDEIHKKFGKLIINSLYGRMGMNNLENESIIIKKNEFNEYNKNNKITSFIELNNIILINIEKLSSKKIKKNIAIASCITSKARIKLYRAQLDVVKNNGRLLYSDTDSIFAAFEEDVTNKKHGIIDWSKEKIKIKDAIFISPKSYAYISNEDEVVKIKGFNNKSIKFQDIKNKFYNNDDFLNIEGEFKLYKKNMIISKSIESKKLNLLSYDKRLFINNKKKTIPFEKKNDFSYNISHTIDWIR